MDTPEQTTREIAHTISEALAVAAISHRSASTMTGIPLTTLNRRLSGASPLTVTELALLAKVLGITLSELFS